MLFTIRIYTTRMALGGANKFRKIWVEIKGGMANVEKNLLPPPQRKLCSC